ncbi:MAG: UDP-N-acetylmuramoyl-L-alanine--D-glutamate ligase [Phycisphaerales bacterium]
MGEFDGQRVVVMGLGRFGGGLGVARWLAAQGADTLVTDKEPEERLHESVRGLRDLVDVGRIELRLGEHNVSDFTTCDVVVVNPGVSRPWENRFVRAGEASGARVTTEIALLCERLPRRERVIGVTGTSGKSTTAGMIHHGLTGLGVRAHFGGNIGGSMLESLGDIRPDDWVVLELSSAMLHWLGSEASWAGAGVAVVTNFAPNHLDWHGSIEHYEQSKRRLLDAQRPGDLAVLGPGVHAWATRPGVERDEIDEGEGVGGCVLPGAHNALNAEVAARAIGAALGRDHIEGARAAVRSFPGLPHRLRLVHESGGVRVYDDSKSTTPAATLLAVEAIAGTLERGEAGVHLIAGGYDKGIDLSAIARLGDRLGGVYAIGQTAHMLMGGERASLCATLERAVGEAMSRAAPGDAVLLSPGCASWDQFENFEQRGRRFADLAREAGGRRRSA